jgi:hypothetical protein
MTYLLSLRRSTGPPIVIVIIAPRPSTGRRLPGEPSIFVAVPIIVVGTAARGAVGRTAIVVIVVIVAGGH